MTNGKALPLILLAVYSLIIILIETFTSQDYVRNFLGDIKASVPFYGINTTLSATLAWCAALIFFVTSRFELSRRERLFHFSQAAIFIVVGLDDRFMLHENFASFTGLYSEAFILFYGLIELALLIHFSKLIFANSAALKNLFIAAFLFCLMFLVDQLMPSKMLFRLSLEDLLKAWSMLFFALYSWSFLAAQIKSSEQ